MWSTLRYTDGLILEQISKYLVTINPSQICHKSKLVDLTACSSPLSALHSQKIGQQYIPVHHRSNPNMEELTHHF